MAALSGTLLVAPATAEASRPVGPGDSAQGRNLALPGDRAELLRERVRINRGLELVEREMQAQHAEDRGRPPLPLAISATRLRDGEPSAGQREDTTRIRRLVARAKAAVDEGRLAQARSDLAMAAGLTAGSASGLSALHARFAEAQLLLGANGE